MRCINLDWVEVYCLESAENFPHDANFYRNNGWFVNERDYGTRQYAEMFTLEDTRGEPFIEIRRNPVACGMGQANHGIFSEFSCHLRLVNCYCYHENAIDLLSQFLERYQYTVIRLFRLDLALDFERFDKGDDPAKFVQRYLAGKYSKINQGNLSAHAKDHWEGRDFNSCCWGSPKSMVSTKLYNKTLELREAKDKPYIRYAWERAGLVDNYDTLTKRKADGTVYEPQIWRVEFSIRSSARGYFVCEDCNGAKTKTMKIEHTLATYATRQGQIHAFANLAHHYFHFKHYTAGTRKDRCPDKVLFEFNLDHEPYKLDVLPTSTPKPKSIDALKKKLLAYREMHAQNDVRQACDVLLQQLETEGLRSIIPYGADRDEVQLLQLLIARRIKQRPKEPLSDSIETVQSMLEIERELW